MNRPATPPQGKCPQGRDSCPLQCKYNRFLADDLEIHSWELKCLDCGFRQTVAYRSDDEELDWASRCQEICPFCRGAGLTPGINPCG